MEKTNDRPVEPHNRSWRHGKLIRVIDMSNERKGSGENK